MSNTKNNKSSKKFKRLHQPCQITSVCRADLIDCGLSKSKALRVTDAQLRTIAEKLADDYCEQLFWHSLQIIAPHVLQENS